MAYLFFRPSELHLLVESTKTYKDGHRILGEPRQTGDGYYESIVLDPDGNQVEITV